LGAAAWVGHEGQAATYLWPYMFSALADEYDRRYGLDDAHLRAIGALNFANARANPKAQTRRWTLTDAHLGVDETANPLVEGRLRRHDCSQLTDGGAGVVLVSDRFRSGRRRARILGWGHSL